MADLQDRELAESVLRSLLVDSTVNGLRFGALQLLFDTLVVPGEPYINLASAWIVYASRPEVFPENEADIAELSAGDELLAAIALRHKVVSSVEIFDPWPHLVITFADSSVLYLNGKNDNYEPWTAGLGGVPSEERIDVIACPGGGLTFILPSGLSSNNSFKPNPLRSFKTPSGSSGGSA